LLLVRLSSVTTAYKEMIVDTAERRTQRPDGEQRELRIRCSVSSGYATNQDQLAGHGFTGTRDAEG